MPVETLGRYRIERELGRGAMGRVFLAYDTEIQRKVAIKTIQAFEALPAGDRQQVLGADPEATPQHGDVESNHPGRRRAGAHGGLFCQPESGGRAGQDQQMISSGPGSYHSPGAAIAKIEWPEAP